MKVDLYNIPFENLSQTIFARTVDLRTTMLILTLHHDQNLAVTMGK